MTRYDTFGPDDFEPDSPKWEQIAELLEKQIRSGAWGPKYLISEVQLMGKFGVSRPTVRKAMQHLRDQGLIYTRRNLGSFVANGDVPSE
ncbi:GntR family transcriptional regulator [Microtetraspora malaysiensis]|uniref:GntR family transcriptional regulator n=1 Tax=Microtetraspora malaysiensis TaxID=161358 RepID=UPI003D901C3B